MPLVLRAMVDHAIPDANVQRMFWLASFYIGMVIATGIFSYMQNILIARLGVGIVTDIKKDLFRHFLTMPVAWFDTHPVGELISRTESDAERVRELFSRVGLSILASALFFFGMLFICFSLAPAVTIWILIVTPPLLALEFFVFDRIKILYDKSRTYNADITSSVTESVQGFEAIKAFGREAWAKLRLRTVSIAKRDTEIRAQLLERLSITLLMYAAGPLFIALVIRNFAPQLVAGTLTIGTLLVFLDYGRRLVSPLLDITEDVRIIQSSRASLARIFSALDEKSEASGKLVPAPLQASIEFRDVWFRYGDQWVLKGISFSIPRGAHIALVGPSGSGKSTVISLLCKFRTPQKGAILVDGESLESFDNVAWRKKIGLVLQENYLFPGSVLENIRVYDDAIPEMQVWQALSTVQADSIVKNLSAGIYTELQDRGGNLSSGERQLLSFARALVHMPEIIVLDEATASVDVRTERAIQRAMHELARDKTFVTVAHRLSSILEADKILYFREGQIIASGTHAELLAHFPDYAALVRLQFLQEKDKDAAHDAAAAIGRKGAHA